MTRSRRWDLPGALSVWAILASGACNGCPRASNGAVPVHTPPPSIAPAAESLAEQQRLDVHGEARAHAPPAPMPQVPALPAYDPYAPSAVSEPGKWAFAPELDRFDASALLDLRYLNERVAGEHGFVRLDGRGDFVRGDGKPLRFWAVGSGGHGPDLARWVAHARWLAKRGVNLARWHGNLAPKTKGAPLSEVDADARDELWRFVAAMKQAGIYTLLSPYYPHATGKQAGWDLDSDGLSGLLYFEPRVQAAYKAWLRAILVPPNPHTGVALKDEPAVAILQMQNEDSLLFWTTNGIKGRELAQLEGAFFRFVRDKYGSEAAAFRRWDGASTASDAPGAGRLGLYPLWHLTSTAAAGLGAGERLRLADQTEFYATTMRTWNEALGRFLREELGAPQLLNTSNWRPADPVTLTDVERYAATTGDVLALNRYVTSMHEGAKSGWAIVDGDRFQDVSVLTRPGDFPLALKQVAGKGMLVPESNWVPPMARQSEAPFLVASYCGLTGVDALVWFSHGDTQFRSPSSANGFLPSLGKWVAATPGIAGNYPAAALLHRNGYVARGREAVHERRALTDLFDRRVPLIAEQGAYDPNRDASAFADTSRLKQEVDRLAFLVGPVLVTYGQDAAASWVAPLERFIDQGHKRVRSNTGELDWDYGAGIATLDTPFAQGVTGALAARGRFPLSQLEVRSRDAYATILAVSMDTAPLADSHHVLLQIGTLARPSGWKVQPSPAPDGKPADGTSETFEILDHGRAPFQVVRAAAEVSLRNRHLSRAFLLDMNGMARAEVPLTRRGDRLELALPGDAMYVVLR